MDDAVGNRVGPGGVVVDRLAAEMDSDSVRSHNGERVLRPSVISTSSINESTLFGSFLGGDFEASFIEEEGEDTEAMTGSPASQRANNFLKVDRSEVLAGESFTVFWNVSEPRSANDWIGLFRADDLDPFKYLDYRERGLNTVKEGKLVWTVAEDCVTEPKVTVCLRYFRSSGKVAATSSNFVIGGRGLDMRDLLDGLGPLSFPTVDGGDSSIDGIGATDKLYMTLSDISATGLRTSLLGPPSPYLRALVKNEDGGLEPSTVAEQRKVDPCSLTANPSWKGVVIVLNVTPQSSVVLEVRDHFGSHNQPDYSHFLGKAELWVADFLAFDWACTHTLELNKRIPSDNVTGSITFTVSVSKDVPLLESTNVGVSTDEAIGLVDVPCEAMDSHLDANVHANSTLMNGGGKLPLKAGLNVCLLHRDLTPSPINFCDDINWGPSAEPIRSLRETSVGSETSIRTADGLLDDDGKASGCSSLSPTHDATSPDDGVTPVDGDMSSVMSHDDIQVEVVEITGETREQSMSPSHDENGVGSMVEAHLSNQRSSFHTASSPVSASPPVINIEEAVTTEQKVVEEVVTVSSVASNMAAPVVMESPISSEPKEVPVVIEATERGPKEALLLAATETTKEEEERNVPVVVDEEKEMEEQLELMRNHLRHSRRRYSMRHKKRRPQQLEPGNTGSLDRRLEGSGNHSDSPSLQRSATISGARRAYLKGLYGKTEGEGSNADARRKTVAQAAESHTDKHGRQYVMVHSKKTVDYVGSTAADDSHLELQRRRMQLDRRYLSMRRMRGGNLDTRETQTMRPSVTSQGSSGDEIGGLSGMSPLVGDVGDADPVGRDRTISILTDSDRQARTTVLTQVRTSPSRRATASTALDRPPKRSEKIFAAIRGNSLMRASQPSTPRESAIPKAEQQRQEEEEEAKKKYIEEVMKQSDTAVELPGLHFITRKDLYSLINSTGEEGQKFLRNRSLMELVQRIRANPVLFLKYQHSPVIIDTCNTFADRAAPLPPGWERKLSKDGKVFFIDHNTKQTTFIDPRLPLNGERVSLPASLKAPEGQGEEAATEQQPIISFNPRRLAPGQTQELPETVLQGTAEAAGTAEDGEDEEASSREEGDVVTVAATASTNRPRLSYNEQVIVFLRQPDIFTVITGRYRRQLRPELKQLIEALRASGPGALETLSEDPRMFELTLILSLFEEEISNAQPISARANSTVTKLKARRERKRKAFEQKLQNFRYTLDHLGYAQNNRFRFNIRRDHLLEDAYEHIMKSRIRHLQRKRLDVQFKGEEGLDYGGPSREFFFLVSREIFNPYYGLFEYSANDTYTVQISPTSSFIEKNLDWFKFAGRIVGLSIAQGYLLDVFFTRPLYKALLNSTPNLKDLEAIEPGIYSSLVWIQENDPEPLDLTFTVEEEAFGQLVEHELKMDGADILVTDDNKMEYIDLMLRWRLDRGVHEQTQAFVSGFREIIPGSLVRQFDAQEIEFVIAGVLEVDVEDWKENTDYRNGYHSDHPVIFNFWKAVEYLDNEQRLRLLQFVTGTSSVPFEGFRALKGSSGPKKFNIELWGEPHSLPRSHTCFNRLDLPPYKTFDELLEKLTFAMEEGGTFGIE